MVAAIDFRRLFYALPTPYMILDRELRFLDMNERYLAVTERTRKDLIGRYVFDAFPESGERLAMFKNAFERAVAGEANSLVKRPFAIPRPDGGMREVWWTCHHIPAYDSEGRLRGMVQHAEDLTAEVTAERMRDVISREFDHRVKNLLFTISTIARRTAKASRSTEAFLADFDARLNALARTHTLLVAGGWEGMSLGDLLESELRPYREDERHVITVSGPLVALTSHQGQTLGLALHELATNAAKYGALKAPRGRLGVQWSVDSDKLLRIDWAEHGLAGVREPEAKGFGSMIIEKMVPYELSGSVERRFLPDGMRCVIKLPLQEANSQTNNLGRDSAPA